MIKITLEELDIIVSASIEPAIKEIKKLMPQIRQQTSKVVEITQKNMEKIDMKNISTKIQQGVNFIKNKIEKLKKTNKNNEISINVTNKDAQKQITQIEKEIDSLQKKISARQLKLDIINPQMDKILNDTRNTVVPDGISKNDKSLDSVINNALASNKDFTSLNAQAQKLYTEIDQYNKLLNQAKDNMAKLKSESVQTTNIHNKLRDILTLFKGKIGQANEIAGKLKNNFSQMPKITQNITNNIKTMGIRLKTGLAHVIKYAAALFSLHGIYSILSNSANSWLSSQNAGAKQLNANIEYMKYSLGSVFAPIIEYVINLVYQLMKAIQSMIYALSGINIFANASAKAYSNMAGSAQKAAKETKALVGIHSDINNIQNTNNSGSESGGSSAPSFDLSGVDNQLSPIAQKLYDFFKPLKESWDKYGSGLINQLKKTAGQVSNLIANVWKSFEKIITNGTVYRMLENILAIIGNIAEAFANAWNYNGNGNAIIQSLANALNNLLTAINNVVQSDIVQSFLNAFSDKIREIAEKLESINWQPFIEALAELGGQIGLLALNVLSGLVDVLKWLIEHPDVSVTLIKVAIAFKTISTVAPLITGLINIVKGLSGVIGIFKGIGEVFGLVSAGAGTLHEAMVAVFGTIGTTITGIVSFVSGAIIAIQNFIDMLVNGFNWLNEVLMLIGIAISAVGAVIMGVPAAIAAAIAAIVAAIMTAIVVIKEHWNEICAFFSQLWENMKAEIEREWTAISNFFSGLWEGIKNTISTVWNAITTFFTNTWNTIKNTAMSVFEGIKNVISTVINTIKNTISNTLNTIKNVWNNIWNGLKNTVSNIFNGIWNTIKSVINSILGGIEGMANGVVSGINVLLEGIEKVANEAGSIIGIDPISLKLSPVTLPRLKKGNVAYEETLGIFGEYTGASNNPEITAPQNILKETFSDVLSEYALGNNGNNNGELKQLVIQFGTIKTVLELEKLIAQAKRQGGRVEVAI